MDGKGEFGNIINSENPGGFPATLLVTMAEKTMEANSYGSACVSSGTADEFPYMLFP